MSLLCEEYVQRNQLQLPFVRYVTKGCYVFKDKEQNYVLLFVSYKKNQNGGDRFGNHTITISKPILNDRFQVVHEVMETTDGFESFLFDWSRSLEYSCLYYTKEEVCLAIWEIFLISHNKKISESISCNFVFDTINLELDIRERYCNYIQLFDYISKYHIDIFQIWRNDFLPITEEFMYWINDLVEK